MPNNMAMTDSIGPAPTITRALRQQMRSRGPAWRSVAGQGVKHQHGKRSRLATPFVALLVAAVLLVAACSGSESPGATGATTASAIPAFERTWATAELVDVTTGEAFRISDLAGKVVIVETMAIWCTSCRAQQANVEQALERLPAGRVAYVLLDVDPSENAESLARYREQYGYTGRYVIATADVARALAADFGDQFLSPPSTPIVVIAADGTLVRTDFGQKSADELVDIAIAGGA
jgi:thiol-disulfide isomerase/thioredoxin